MSEVRPDTRYFGRGLITNLLNPKAMLFYVAVLPTFIDPSESVLEQSLTLTAVYVGIATFVHGFIVALAGSVQPLVANGKMRKVSCSLRGRASRGRILAGVVNPLKPEPPTFHARWGSTSTSNSD